MIIDNHVHVGWYRDGYHSPKEIWEAETAAGVDEICVSSTSTCAELYDIVIEEMIELKRLGEEVRCTPSSGLLPKCLNQKK